MSGVVLGVLDNAAAFRRLSPPRYFPAIEGYAAQNQELAESAGAWYAGNTHVHLAVGSCCARLTLLGPVASTS